MAPIVATLAGAGLKLLSDVINKKGKEYVEKKFNIKIPDDVSELTQDKIKELKEIEYKHQEELKRLLLEEKQMYIDDTKNARTTYKDINISEETPYINKIFPSILSGGTVLLTFGMFYLFATNNVNDAQKDIVIYILGVLSTLTTQIFSFYFGSSSGSKEKTNMFRNLFKK